MNRRLDRRAFVATSLLAAAAPGAALARGGDDDRYDADEVVKAGSDFLGVTAEAIGGAIERISRDYGSHPNGYIAGTEVSASLVGGLRYG